MSDPTQQPPAPPEPPRGLWLDNQARSIHGRLERKVARVSGHAKSSKKMVLTSGVKIPTARHRLLFVSMAQIAAELERLIDWMKTKRLKIYLDPGKKTEVTLEQLITLRDPELVARLLNRAPPSRAPTEDELEGTAEEIGEDEPLDPLANQPVLPDENPAKTEDLQISVPPAVEVPPNPPVDVLPPVEEPPPSPPVVEEESGRTSERGSKSQKQSGKGRR